MRLFRSLNYPLLASVGGTFAPSRVEAPRT
jgi:hypothetical protein